MPEARFPRVFGSRRGGRALLLRRHHCSGLWCKAAAQAVPRLAAVENSVGFQSHGFWSPRPRDRISIVEREARLGAAEKLSAKHARLVEIYGTPDPGLSPEQGSRSSGRVEVRLDPAAHSFANSIGIKHATFAPSCNNVGFLPLRALGEVEPTDCPPGPNVCTRRKRTCGPQGGSPGLTPSTDM